MKKGPRFRICSLFIAGAILMLSGSCTKKENKPYETGTVMDVEGNVYKTVKIGTQWWMAENLRTTRYNDCSAIPLVEDSDEWGILTSPAYCFYNNDAAKYKSVYGALYNWYAVNTGKLAPDGWHVPTDSEWTILTDFLGGKSQAGLKMREAGTTHWTAPNRDADNSSGFSALPGSSRISNGVFNPLGRYGYWWTSSGDNTYSSWGRSLDFSFPGVYSYNFVDQANGFSVRCVKD